MALRVYPVLFPNSRISSIVTKIKKNINNNMPRVHTKTSDERLILVYCLFNIGTSSKRKFAKI